MKTRNKRVVIDSLSVGDKVWICSIDKGKMSPNANIEIILDLETIFLIKENSKLNYVFSNQADMLIFINKYNLIK